LRIFDEERALGAELPGYKDYLVAVPWRLIPRLW
jgi:protein-S-isoprenylcysteine O-methyltransferase Ste14